MSNLTSTEPNLHSHIQPLSFSLFLLLVAVPFIVDSVTVISLAEVVFDITQTTTESPSTTLVVVGVTDIPGTAKKH